MTNYPAVKPSQPLVLAKNTTPIRLDKTPLITATVSWRTGTDYDIYALVLLANDQTVHVATFGAAGVPAMPDWRGLVHHRGNVGRDEVARDGHAEETIDIRLTDEIRAVIPVAYSAQSNGTGSFYRYAVGLEVDNGAGQRVRVPADEANDDDLIYTCVPAIIHNQPDGVWVERVELYSRPGDEHRPAVAINRYGRVTVTMGMGPRNDYK